MASLDELKAKKVNLVAEARGIIDKAKEAGVGSFDEKVYDKIMAEVRGLHRLIQSEEELAAMMPEDRATIPTTMPATHRTDPTDDGGKAAADKAAAEKRVWPNLGEQLRAVFDASLGNTVDPRLLEHRAPTGASVSIPSEGGFLVQNDFAQALATRTFEVGQLLNRCDRIPIGPGANGIKLRGFDDSSRVNGARYGGIRAYWLNEADEKTKSTITKFRMHELSLQKIAALCYATDELLEDAVALEGLINRLFPQEFTFVIEDALMRGSGVAQPFGILNSPALISVDKETNQSAATVLYENIRSMWYRFYAPLRRNAVWYINQEVEPQLHSMVMTVGTGGVPVYLPPGGLSVDGYGTLFGRPVVPCEYCSALGTVGDIILADFGQYLIIDKGGMRTDQSMHVRFINDETVFRFVMRLNGKPWWDEVLTPYKGSATYSPYVTLKARA